MKQNRGFTLIELLVCIFIIAILSSFLFPVYIQAKKNSYKSECASNLKQLYIAISMYNTDYDGYYPNSGNAGLFQGRQFRWLLAPYTGFSAKYDSNDPNNSLQITNAYETIFGCPSDNTSSNIYDKTSYGYSACFYISPEVINMQNNKFFYLNDLVVTNSINESYVAYPANKGLISDWAGSHDDVKDGWWSWDGSRNILFADGHIKYTKATSINAAMDGFPDINVTKDGVLGKDIE